MFNFEPPIFYYEGGGGGGGSGDGETNPNGPTGPPAVGSETVPAVATNPNSNNETTDGSGTNASEPVVSTDGTTPGDNDGYEGEIRTVMTANGPTMYIKQNGTWVIYYGNDNFAPDGSNITSVIANALNSLGFSIDSEQALAGTGGDTTLTGDITLSNLTVTGSLNSTGSESNIDHGTLGGKDDDDHGQYVLSVGRPGIGGQTIIGGTQSADDLTLLSTSHGTKGTVFINSTGLGGGVLIGSTGTPDAALEVVGVIDPSGTNVALQLTRSEDNDDHIDFITSSTGDLTVRAVSEHEAPSITLQTYTGASSVAGDIVFGNTGGDVRPNDTTPQVNLGAIAKKFKEIHAETLRVETLVSDNVIATIGGRIIVTPSSTLGVALISESTSTVKLMHNSLGGHYIVLKSGGNAEYIKLGSQSGDSPHSDGVRTMYHYPSSARNKNGLGSVPTWDAGTSVASYAGGAAGDGMMELYSQSALLVPGSSSGTAPVGPTILGLKRTSATNYYDTVESFAVGNLNNLFGENGDDQYGIAAGNYTANGTWMRASNLGFALKYSSTSTVTKFEVDSSGNTQVGSGSYVLIGASTNAGPNITDTDGGTEKIDSGDILLYGGNTNKYMWLDSSASKMVLRSSATNYLELSGSAVSLVSANSSIALDGVSGQITASGIISGASLQTGSSGPRVVISDNSIANHTGIGGLCSFVEISPHGSGGTDGGNDTDLVHIGIYKNGSGSVMRLGGDTVTNGKIRGRLWNSASQGYSIASGDNNVNLQASYTRWQEEAYDGANTILYQQILSHASPGGISTHINKASVDNYYVGNEMSTPHFAVDATDDEYGSAIDRSYIATGGYLKVGQSIQGNSGTLLIIPASDNYAGRNLYEDELNDVISNYGSDTLSTVITGVAGHHWMNNVTNIISDRATIFTSRACTRDASGVVTNAGGKNVFGYASGCMTNGGRHSIHRVSGNQTGWAVGVLSKQTENSRAMLLWIFISDTTVSWSFLDSGSNNNTTDGDGFAAETVTMTADPDSYMNASALRVQWSNTSDPQKYVYWHQICGSVAMVCSYDA